MFVKVEGSVNLIMVFYVGLVSNNLQNMVWTLIYEHLSVSKFTRRTCMSISVSSKIICSTTLPLIQLKRQSKASTFDLIRGS